MPWHWASFRTPGGSDVSFHFNITPAFELCSISTDPTPSHVFSQPVQRILAAHVQESSFHGRQRDLEAVRHSVTSVAFLDDTLLASAGASDGTVKIWDLRMNFYNVPGSIFAHQVLFPL
jgi:WD40 repeat protein